MEGGVKYLLAEYATTFTASVFNIRQKNVVTSDPGFLNYRQTGEVESKGAELSAISRPTDADCQLCLHPRHQYRR